jgi:single-strand DNA-binding protein
MSFDVTGRLHKKFETEKKTETFQAREFVIEIDEGSQYPQFIKFQLVQDRCGIIDDYNEGDQIKVHFDLRGREWNEKYFTNLNAWRIEKGGADAGPPPPAEDDFTFPSAESEAQSGGGNVQADDDLPF